MGSELESETELHYQGNSVRQQWGCCQSLEDGIPSIYHNGAEGSMNIAERPLRFSSRKCTVACMSLLAK